MQNLKSIFEQSTIELFEKYSIYADDIKSFVKCDMKSFNKYGECWILLTDSEILSVSEDGGFVRKSIEDIKEVYVESFVSSGCVIAVCETEEVALGYFSLTVAKNVEKFVSSVQRVKADMPEKSDVPTYSEEDFINKGRKKLFMRVLSYVPKYKNQLVQIIAIIVLSSLLNIVQPYLTGTVLYDNVLGGKGILAGKLFLLVGMLVALSAFSVVLGILRGRIGAEMSGNIVFDIKTEVFGAMQKLGMRFFTSKRTGSLLNRVNSDALDIQYFLNDGLPNFIINAVTIMGIGLVLFIANPLLSITVLIPVPLIAFIIKKSTRKFKRLKWHSWHRSSKLNSLINDCLLGIRVVKAFGREKNEIKRFEDVNEELYKNRLREGVAAAKVFPFLSWIMAAAAVFVWGIGGIQVLGGKLTFGQLMTFVGYLTLLYEPMNFMVKTFDWWTNCMNSAQRIFEVIDRETDVPEDENPVELKNLEGNIELKNVTFSYEPNRNVLKNVSFKVEKGEMIGLVGHSGAGKSTITNIITRLYDVNDGEVLIDGVNVKKLKKDVLHSNIGMVLQDTFLFTGTIAENIAYGRPDASFEEIVDAAKKAYAHEFIINLPEGYETEIGKRSVNLSGGEKQRISIARAILMNPKILILDEATASLDTETEKKIQNALDKLVKGRTTIAIAHRLSTLRNADRLVVVENGCIVEIGTHEELFANTNGVYHKMARKQLEALHLYTDSSEVDYE